MMNQLLKGAVYALGTTKQVEFLATLGGMNDEEKQTLLMLHDGSTDLQIQSEMNLSKSAYKQIEERVRKKLIIAIFDCINYRMLFSEK